MVEQAHQVPQSTENDSVDILEQLRDIWGRNLGEQIRNRLNPLNEKKQKNPLKRVIITGIPGAGKTTLMNSIEKILRDMGYEVTKKSFDKQRQGFLEIKKLQGYPANTLSDTNPESFAKFLSLSRRRDAEVSHSENGIELKEFPGIGKDVERGQSELREIGLTTTEETIPETLVIHIIPQDRIRKKAKQVREIVENCSNDKEVKERLRAIGINLGEVNEDDAERTDLLEEFGRMATPYYIDIIGDELTQMANDAYDVIVKEWAPHVIKTVLEAVAQHIPKEVDEDEWDDLTKKIVFIYYLFFREFHFPSDQMFLVAINIFAEQGVNYNIFNTENE